MSTSIIGSIVTRRYRNFKGVDLLNPINQIDLSRSPDALNVWKSYDTTESNIIQTRPRIFFDYESRRGKDT